MGSAEVDSFIFDNAVTEAWNSRKPSAVSWGRGHSVIGFNRRVSYSDGTTAMYGQTNKPEFSHLEGSEDHGVEIMCTYDVKHKLTGMRIKARSKAIQTFIIQLAGNGSYLPTERAMRGGGYGAYVASTPIDPDGGQMIVEQQVKDIDTLFLK